MSEFCCIIEGGGAEPGDRRGFRIVCPLPPGHPQPHEWDTTNRA